MKKLTKKDLQNLGKRTLIEDFDFEDFQVDGIHFIEIKYYYDEKNNKIIKMVSRFNDNMEMPKTELYGMDFKHFEEYEMRYCHKFENLEEIKKIKKISNIISNIKGF